MQVDEGMNLFRDWIRNKTNRAREAHALSQRRRAARRRRKALQRSVRDLPRPGPYYMEGFPGEHHGRGGRR